MLEEALNIAAAINAEIERELEISSEAGATRLNSCVLRTATATPCTQQKGPPPQ